MNLFKIADSADNKIEGGYEIFFLSTFSINNKNVQKVYLCNPNIHASLNLYHVKHILIIDILYMSLCNKMFNIFTYSIHKGIPFKGRK